jgi:hypothetical protein
MSNKSHKKQLEVINKPSSHNYVKKLKSLTDFCAGGGGGGAGKEVQKSVEERLRGGGVKYESRAILRIFTETLQLILIFFVL